MSQIKTVPCKYKTGKTLGQGTYAVVKEAAHIETGEFFAAKIMNKRLMRGRESMIRNEISILKKISQGHPNILTLVDYFETANNLYLITELATGGELFDRICEKGSFFESDAAEMIYTVVDAVGYLHDNGIVHRDLKPENLLFRSKKDSQLVVGDFGLSRVINSEEQFDPLTTTCGTPGYMAPEVFKKTGYGKPVDMWAIGVITYFLLCGYPPFELGDDISEVTNIINAKYSFEPEKYWKGVSDTAKEFINILLVSDPNERADFRKAKEHPWLMEAHKNKMAGTVDEKTTEAKQAEESNLLPTVRENFNARGTFKKAVGLVKAINKIKNLQTRPVEEDLQGEDNMVTYKPSQSNSPIPPPVKELVQ